MPIAYDDGTVYESEWHEHNGITMQQEEQQSEAPLKITVHPEPKPKETSSIGFSDIMTSIGNDLSKFGSQLADAITLGPKLMEKVYNGEIDPTSEEGIKAVNDVAMTFGLGGIATAPLRQGAGMFGGELGAKAGASRPTFYSLGKKNVLDQADEAFRAGKTPEQVFKEYGVVIGPDEKLRFEFSDKGARLKTENMTLQDSKHNLDAKVPQYMTPYSRTTLEKDVLGNSLNFVEKGPKTVGDILDHPTLYKHYPDIKDIKLDGGPLFDFLGGIRGWHIPDKNQIFVRGDTEKEMLSTLLHEVQHAIQTREGHARGGNPKQFIPTPEVFDEVAKKAVELDTQLKTRWVLDGVKEEINKELLPEWKKRYWVGEIQHADLSYALKEYAKEGEFKNPLHEALVRLVYQKDPDLLKDTMTLVDAKILTNKLEHEAHTKYKQLFGEFEARLTQERQGMTDAERKANFLKEGKEFKETYPEGVIPSDSIVY